MVNLLSWVGIALFVIALGILLIARRIEPTRRRFRVVAYAVIGVAFVLGAVAQYLSHASVWRVWLWVFGAVTVPISGIWMRRES
jgi:multisubunit Na+/H+ antiporter MnhB subunit